MTQSTNAVFLQALGFSRISDTAKRRNGLCKRVLELSYMSEMLHMTFRSAKLIH